MSIRVTCAIVMAINSVALAVLGVWPVAVVFSIASLGVLTVAVMRGER